MKKLNKILLPLCAATAVAAVCPPLVACGNKTINTGVVDLLNYRPDPSTKHVEDNLTNKQATAACFSGNDALAITSQDILRYLSWQVKYEFDFLVAALFEGYDIVCALVPNYATCDLSNLSIQYKETSEESFARLSGTIKLEVNIDVLSEESATISPIGTLTLQTEHKLSQMKYTMAYYNPGELWTTDYWVSHIAEATELEEDDVWFVDANAHSEITYYGSDHVDVKEYHQLYNHEHVDTDRLGLLTWWSYHLLDCKQG